MTAANKSRAILILCASFLSCIGFGSSVGQEYPRCDYKLVKTTPVGQGPIQGLPFQIVETFEAFVDLINSSKHSIKIASFYMTLTPSGPRQKSHPSTNPARLVREALIGASKDRGVAIEILVGMDWTQPEELKEFLDAGIVFSLLNVTSLIGSGVQHSKFMIVDNESLYLGSANLDWRALAHVSELGIMYSSCPDLALDLGKIFDTYKHLSSQKEVPRLVPEQVVTRINATHPLLIQMNGVLSKAYLATSPRAFDGENNHRSNDLEEILAAFNDANKFIYATVMNYSPVDFDNNRKFWPVIKDAVRQACKRGIHFKLIVSGKNFSHYEIRNYKSFTDLNSSCQNGGSVEVKGFQVPVVDAFQASLPHSRIHHDKYIVTDNKALISTSNWTPNYFSSTTGVCLVIRPTEASESSIVTKLKSVFESEYNSEFSTFVG